MSLHLSDLAAIQIRNYAYNPGGIYSENDTRHKLYFTQQ
jgi:hypothetical protein